MNPVGKAINNYPHGSMICRIHKNGEFGDGGSYCFTNIIWKHCDFTKHRWYTMAYIYIHCNWDMEYILLYACMYIPRS
jgi:hypothetical protein